MWGTQDSTPGSSEHPAEPRGCSQVPESKIGISRREAEETSWAPWSSPKGSALIPECPSAAGGHCVAVRTDGRPLGGAVDHSEEPRSVRRRLRAPAETPRCWSQVWGCRQSPRGPPVFNPAAQHRCWVSTSPGAHVGCGFLFPLRFAPRLVMQKHQCHELLGLSSASAGRPLSHRVN